MTTEKVNDTDLFNSLFPSQKAKAIVLVILGVLLLAILFGLGKRFFGTPTVKGGNPYNDPTGATNGNGQQPPANPPGSNTTGGYFPPEPYPANNNNAGTGLVVQPHVAQLVQRTIDVVRKVYFLPVPPIPCYKSQERCQVWSQWLTLNNVDFKAGLIDFQNRFGGSLQSAIKSIGCGFTCDSANHSDRVIERIARTP